MATRTRPSAGLRPIALSAVISLLLLAIGFWSLDHFTLAAASRHLAWPLVRLMFFITLGLFLGQLIEASGWTRYLAAFARPVFRFSHMGNRASAAFTTAFFSGVTANAMLIDFYNDRKISRRELYLANLLNQFPGFFLHLPTTFFIVVPLTGWAGVLYFGLTFAATLLRSALLLLYGRLFLPARDRNPEAGMPAMPGKRKTGVLASIKKKLPGRLTRIAVWVIPIYILVYIVNAKGWFTQLRDILAQYSTAAFVPVEALSMVILSFVAEFTSGFATAGALMDAGVISVKQTVMALIAGNIIAFPIRALRHQLPYYMGIFAPRMGLQLILLGQGLRILSLALVAATFYILV